jgi:hypothetical protein
MILSRPKLIALIASGVVVAGVLAGWYASRATSQPPPDLGPVIARVDGKPIYLSEARSRVEGLRSVHGDIVKVLGTDWPQKVMQSLVDDKILAEEAGRRGIVIGDSEVQSSLLKLQQQFGGEQGFDSWLSDQGMSRTEIERRILLQLEAAQVYEAVTSDVTVPVGDLRDYYRKHRSDYTGSDGETLPFGTVRQSLHQTFEKERKDAAYAEWLKGARAAADVVIVDQDWWRSIDGKQS